MLSVESGGQNLAVSPVGAAGLMQIMPLTARRLGLRIYNEKGYIFPEDIGQRGAWALYSRYAKEIQQLAKENPQKLMKLDDRFNPQKNINAAARYMSRLVEEYGVEGAVAAYNGGHRGLAANKPRETRAYLRLVLR
jgi:soluble lytic murein transglycosylase-like protein